jgi:hypothetical protein
MTLWSHLDLGERRMKIIRNCNGKSRILYCIIRLAIYVQCSSIDFLWLNHYLSLCRIKWAYLEKRLFGETNATNYPRCCASFKRNLNCFQVSEQTN